MYSSSQHSIVFDNHVICGRLSRRRLSLIGPSAVSPQISSLSTRKGDVQERKGGFVFVVFFTASLLFLVANEQKLEKPQQLQVIEQY